MVRLIKSTEVSVRIAVMKAVIVANGELKPTAFARKTLRSANLIIAADGGLTHVQVLGFRPNLVVGDTNGAADVFVRDSVSGTTERISVGSGGEQATGGCQGPCFSAAISADGRFVARVWFG